MSPHETALGPVARAAAGNARRPSVSFEFSPPKTPEAEETKRILVRLSGRRMKYGVISTVPALLAGYLVLLSITDLLEHTDYDLRKIKVLADNALPFLDTS